MTDLENYRKAIAEVDCTCVGCSGWREISMLGIEEMKAKLLEIKILESAGETLYKGLSVGDLIGTLESWMEE